MLRLRNPFGHQSLSRQEARVFYMFVAPWLLGFLVFTLYPLLASFEYSFTDYNGVEKNFVGLQNYRDMLFDDPLFYKSLWVTAKYTLVSVPIQIVAALMLAVLLNQQVPFLAFWRTVYYLPSIISGVASALLWRWILNPDVGLMNYGLSQVGITGIRWFWSEQWAIPGYWIMDLWRIGGAMVIYLAALQGVPTVLYEAAEIDGANAWQKFHKITIPMISPVLLFTLITGLISSFQVFTQVFVISNQSSSGLSLGGPNNATMMYTLYLYQNGFRWSKLGYASALSWVLFIIIMVLTILALRTTRRMVYQDFANAS